MINGIGPSRCADLQYEHIDTAADIEWNRLFRVRGIGPARASELMAWRQEIEARFRFDPKSIAHTLEFRRIEQDFAQQQSQLELALIGGARKLKDIAAQADSQRALLEPKTKEMTT